MMHHSRVFLALWQVFIADFALGLTGTLLTDYDDRQIPQSLPGDDKVVIRISMALRMVVELDAKNQVLTTSVWIRLRWYDDRLRWNPRDWNSKEKIIMPQADIWKPDLVLYDNTDFDYSGAIQDVFATVWYNGTVSLVYPALFKSACQINIYYFPFDQQTCQVRFSSWTYDKSRLVFELDPKRAADTSYYKFNSEWLLTNFSAETHEEYIHDCCLEPMQDVTFELTLRRRSIMLFYYLYFPNILINIIATFQFLLPCDSTEKVTLGITILLAMIVYLLLMEEMLPQTEVVPIIVHYMSITLGLVTASLLITIVVLEVHHNGKHDNHSQLPHWARKYMLHGLARFLHMDKYITSDLEREQLMNAHASHVSLVDDDQVAEFRHEDTPASAATTANAEWRSSNPNKSASNNVSNNAKTGKDKKTKTQTTTAKNPQSSTVHGPSVASAISSIYRVTPMVNSTNSNVQGAGGGAAGSGAAGSGAAGGGAAGGAAGGGVGAGGGSGVVAGSSHDTPAEYHHHASHYDHESIIGTSQYSIIKRSELATNRELLLLKILHYCEAFAERATIEEREQELSCEWQQMAMLLDRLVFYLYIIVTIIVWIIILGSKPNYTDSGIK